MGAVVSDLAHACAPQHAVLTQSCPLDVESWARLGVVEVIRAHKWLSKRLERPPRKDDALVIRVRFEVRGPNRHPLEVSETPATLSKQREALRELQKRRARVGAGNLLNDATFLRAVTWLVLNRAVLTIAPLTYRCRVSYRQCHTLLPEMPARKARALLQIAADLARKSFKAGKTSGDADVMPGVITEDGLARWISKEKDTIGDSVFFPFFFFLVEPITKRQLTAWEFVQCVDRLCTMTEEQLLRWAFYNLARVGTGHHHHHHDLDHNDAHNGVHVGASQRQANGAAQGINAGSSDAPDQPESDSADADGEQQQGSKQQHAYDWYEPVPTLEHETPMIAVSSLPHFFSEMALAAKDRAHPSRSFWDELRKRARALEQTMDGRVRLLKKVTVLKLEEDAHGTGHLHRNAQAQQLSGETQQEKLDEDDDNDWGDVADARRARRAQLKQHQDAAAQYHHHGKHHRDFPLCTGIGDLITVAEFLDMAKRSPLSIFDLIYLQLQIRRLTFGERFWVQRSKEVQSFADRQDGSGHQYSWYGYEMARCQPLPDPFTLDVLPQLANVQPVSVPASVRFALDVWSSHAPSMAGPNEQVRPRQRGAQKEVIGEHQAPEDHDETAEATNVGAVVRAHHDDREAVSKAVGLSKRRVDLGDDGAGAQGTPSSKRNISNSIRGVGHAAGSSSIRHVHVADGNAGARIPSMRAIAETGMSDELQDETPDGANDGNDLPGDPSWQHQRQNQPARSRPPSGDSATAAGQSSHPRDVSNTKRTLNLPASIVNSKRTVGPAGIRGHLNNSSQNVDGDDASGGGSRDASRSGTHSRVHSQADVRAGGDGQRNGKHGTSGSRVDTSTRLVLPPITRSQAGSRRNSDASNTVSVEGEFESDEDAGADGAAKQKRGDLGRKARAARDRGVGTGPQSSSSTLGLGSALSMAGLFRGASPGVGGGNGSGSIGSSTDVYQRHADADVEDHEGARGGHYHQASGDHSNSKDQDADTRAHAHAAPGAASQGVRIYQGRKKKKHTAAAGNKVHPEAKEEATDDAIAAAHWKAAHGRA